MNPKNVLLATYEYPPDVGGIASYLSGLVEALPFTTSVLRMNSPKGPFRWLFDVPKVWKAARAHHADLLIVSHLLPLGTIAWLIFKMTGLRYAVIVHGTDLKRAASHPRKSRLARQILADASFVAANSAYTLKLTEQLGVSKEKSVVVYPCPAPDPKEGDGMSVRRKHGLENKKVILSVARLVPRKGHRHLIEVLRKLRQECGDIVLLIVGSGPEEAALKEEAKKHRVEESVIFAGRVPQEELPSYFKAGDVFALVGHEEPDDVEGFGLVYLEAALHGLPSVAGRTGGAGEAVVSGQTGIVVDSDAPDALFAALCELLTDTPRAVKMGEWGRARAQGEFTWKTQAAKFAHMIEAL